MNNNNNNIPYCLSDKSQHEFISVDCMQVNDYMLSVTYECLDCHYSFYDYVELLEER